MLHNRGHFSPHKPEQRCPQGSRLRHCASQGGRSQGWQQSSSQDSCLHFHEQGSTQAEHTSPHFFGQSECVQAVSQGLLREDNFKYDS